MEWNVWIINVATLDSGPKINTVLNCEQIGFGCTKYIFGIGPGYVNQFQSHISSIFYSDHPITLFNLYPLKIKTQIGVNIKMISSEERKKIV